MAVVSVSNLGLAAARAVPLTGLHRRGARPARASPVALGRSGGEGEQRRGGTTDRRGGRRSSSERRSAAAVRREATAAEEVAERKNAAEEGDEDGKSPSGGAPKAPSGRPIRRASGEGMKPRRSPWTASHIAEEWASFTGPRATGDVRDVVLMSFSFALLIYISQHLVHAYCALNHMHPSRF